jgi:thiamine biosynthesis lipoprotein
MAVAEHRFRAMGGACHVVAVAPTTARAKAATRDAESLVADLERRWSRFRDDSEISRLNARRRLVVSVDTYDVVARACAAWQATAGRFDPTVGRAVAALGYDRSFELVGRNVVTAPRAVPAPGCAGIGLDAAASAVTLPRGVRLDLGAIGKGRAADLVAERLDADGVCVNVGGDLRVRGAGPDGGDWVVAVEAPDDQPATILALAGGGVATSSPDAKTWRAGDRLVHHVVDPRTGLPATTDVASATVVAGEAWWAEVLATCALLAGARRALADVAALGGAPLLHLADGTVRTGVTLAPYLAAAS